MRPRKVVLLLMRSEIEMSRWRFVIETHAGYRVLGETWLESAKRRLSEHPEIEAVLTNVAGPLGADALAGHGCRVLLFGIANHPETTDADAIELERDDLGGLVERVLNRLRILTVRKRGPKKQVAAVAFIPTVCEEGVVA
jgi:hypothetical protein